MRFELGFLNLEKIGIQDYGIIAKKRLENFEKSKY